MDVVILHQVKKIFDKENHEIVEDVFEIIELLRENKYIGMPHVKSLYNIYLGLFEIRVKDEHGQFRVIYYIKRGDTIFLIHAFRKKTNEIKKKEIKVIMKRIKEIIHGKI